MAARVRELLAQHADGPAARTFSDDPDEAPSAWLPDADFNRHVPRHESLSRDSDRAFGAGLRSRLRWDPGRRGAAALGVLLVAVVAATGWWLAAGRPRDSALPAASEAAVSAPTMSAGTSPATVSESAVMASASPTPSSSAAAIVVDVDGKVRRPGLYTLAPGSRVNDAVEAAGGVRPGVRTVSLNLAQPISDGEQIVVGRASGSVNGAAGGPVVGASDPDPSSSATVVDLNTATLADLETLPGIGPALGQRILDWRSAHGQFTSVEQLQDVSGIGDVRYAEISPLVTV